MVDCLAGVCLLQWNVVQCEAQTSVLSFLEQCKDRAVARFQTKVGVTAIECTCKAVIAVDAIETLFSGLVLDRALNAPFILIIRFRLDKVSYGFLCGSRHRYEHRESHDGMS